ncbi:site-specific integrase [Nitratiruptor sp. SB155-2]|uniref:site-specific integrase n=1 Tax=Nitratiruptor sp. (strain SB155-2) TaxID=387092 RepID=UPI0002DC4E87|nr:site-specific integrase [Nitratiruptor sp. SB155-2]
MVSIFRRGKKLYLQFMVGGKPKQKSTGLDDTKANRQLVKKHLIPKLEAKIISGELEAELKAKETPKAFRYYAEKYLLLKEQLKTYDELSKQVDKLIEVFDKDIDAITRGEIKEWSAFALRDKTPKTVRKYLNLLGSIFDTAIEYGVIKDNPARKIKLPVHIEKHKEPFSSDEVELLLSTASGWFRNYLAIAFFTGMRPGEIIALTKDDVNLKRRTINVSKARRYGKTTTPKTVYSIREVPILDALVPYLMDQIENSSYYLFTNSKGDQFWDAKKLHPYWKEVIEQSGLMYREMYATRHTFITAMLKSGYVSVMELAQIVGHKNSTEIMNNYARFISGEHLKISKQIDPFNCKSTDSGSLIPIVKG